ncbi:TIGR02680 family protein [Nocardiopsis baichengensis]|uniref:TIGR02680 family protein n=1 Tax=Nocardiopsis baichengensis TaxID=280240 RepID=UPI000373D927|nr:TIGR02680 family protein [Nocardiopsis baichengensis]
MEETGGTATGTPELPVPRTERWQPLRTGIIDLFYYDSQEFWFRDGRVLFRGNNGTGKSKVLALTVPFLLDADLSASRVEPDGDRGKRMEWNLLMGGRYDERLGYAWLEFGRVGENGDPEFLTVGAGLKAVAGRGMAGKWFFTTSQRIGRDLFLIGPAGAALSKDRLEAAVEGHGRVVERAEQYRRMLDEHLFHLGEERYAAMVNLLIQLRQPQLSKRPDEKRLSQALTEALTPLDQAVLSDIATAFHDLEQQRTELDGLRDTHRGVVGFLKRYRRYASVAARRQAAELRSAQHGYEDLQRALAAVRDEVERADQEEREAAERLEQAGTDRAQQGALLDELRTDPRLKDLADAERRAAEAADAARRARSAADRAAQVLDERTRRRDTAAASAQESAAGVAKARRPADGAAERAGIGGLHAQIAFGPAEDAAPDAPPDAAPAADPDAVLDTAEREAARIADIRAEAAAHVQGLAEEAARAEGEVVQARRTLAGREADRDAAGDGLDEAQDSLAEAVREHIGQWRSYQRSLTELSLPAPEETGVEEWAETLDGPHPMRTAVREASGAVHRSLASAEAQAEARASAAEAELGELAAERELLEAGATERPPSPHTRGADVRTGPGAALWQAVDFLPGLDAEERAGLEAALEASGLLDAWITPGGAVLDGRTHDVLLTAGRPAGRPLTGALRPAIDPDDAQARALSPEAVADVLSGIGLGEQDARAWVDPAGRWSVGPLSGAWSKDTARYVGAGAREEARRLRLAELARLTGEAQGRLAEARSAADAVRARGRDLADELAREPSDQGLRDAHSAVAGASRHLRTAQERVERAVGELDRAKHEHTEASLGRDIAARDAGLPADLEGLTAVRDALEEYRRRVGALLSAARRHADRLADLRTWTEEFTAAAESAQEADGQASAAQVRAAEEQGRLEALQEAIGASVTELRDRLDAAQRRVAELDAAIGELDKEQRRAEQARAKAEGRAEELTANLDQEERRRDDAIAGFRRFVATGLLRLACDVTPPPEEGPWAAAPAVRLARETEAALRDVDSGDEDWRRAQDSITRSYSELAEALSRQGHHALAGLDDWFVVTVQFQGRERAPAELEELLEGEISHREELLTAKERDLLEEHLVSDVAGHLQQLIADAEEQVASMNAELEERPTSTGMKLRLRWEPSPDGPAGLAQARARLLRQNADLWSPDDRAAVGEFLQREIERTRSADEHGGTWQEHLRRALDYRSWHRFVIERFQDGRWRSAVGPASGGERVLTVSLPLFAAASAHYRSAHRHAPRLVALDEAFAGVDDDARAKCLGLLATFDLDVAMTSEREWGFYGTVPGLAAHHLVRREGVAAVHVSTWEWDGFGAARADRPDSAREPRPGSGGTAGAPAAEAAEAATGSLF